MLFFVQPPCHDAKSDTASVLAQRTACRFAAAGRDVAKNRALAVPLRDLAEMQEVGTISEAKARVLQSDGTTAGTAYMFLFGPGVHF